ncbi:MAG: class I tRNA ligase family protein, partial [Candidatus Paceibacterota bacterium]
AVSAKSLLYQTLTTMLKSMHPFIPFVTEEIWQTMGNTSILMVEKYPVKEPQEISHV